MGRTTRPTKKSPTVVAKIRNVEELQKNKSITLTRSKRTPKPNPKYMSDESELIVAQKISSRSNSSNADESIEKDDSDHEVIEKIENKRLIPTRKKLFTSITPGNAKKLNQEPRELIIRSNNTVKSSNENETSKSSLIISSAVNKKGKSQQSNESFTGTSAAATPKANDKNLKDDEKRILRKRGGNKNDDTDFEMPSSDDEEEEEDEDEKEEVFVRRTRNASKIRKVENTSSAVKATPKPTQPMTTSTPNNYSDIKIRQVTRTINQTKTKSVSPKLQENKPGGGGGIGAANIKNTKTQDIEKDVPTFTIVNIKDIMKKAPDSKTPKTGTIKKKLNSSQSESKDSSEDSSNFEMLLPKSGENKSYDEFFESRSNLSRRKTLHTTILTDDFETKIKANSVNKLAPTKIDSTTKTSSGARMFSNSNTTVPKGKIIQIGNNGKFKDSSISLPIAKPAPRILNSMLGQKKSQFQSPLLDQLDLTLEGTDISPTKNNNKISESKENNKSFIMQQGGNKRTQPTTSSTSSFGQNKSKFQTLMNSKPKIIFENQGGTRVKKITCFETWYVINLPNIEVPCAKPEMKITLTNLGNNIKTIELPSQKWSYHINVTKLTPTQIKEKKARNDNEKYIVGSGDMKHDYIPSSIIFRRINESSSSSATSTLSMKYDRSITFKNSTYFLNVDGCGVKLIGSPQSINNLKEIETLIQIINDVSLVNPYVEQTAFIL